MLDLSIIIVAYNSPDLLQATLESLARHTFGVSYELIVVDNSPAPGIALPEHLIAQLQLIRNPQNAGFAAANNLGLRLSQGRYIALLNPDTLLHDDALSTLVRWLDAHPDVGAVGPQLLQS
ncbi:MAG TPA: glycosyltransferase, partial [Herpetosiphonaceae bacterium]